MGDRRSTIIIVAAIGVVLVLVLAWALIPSAQDEVAAAPLTEIADTAAIQDHIQISRLNIATSENFANQKIRVISASLKNISEKPIRMIELKMVFTDFDGKPIYEYSEKVLERKQRPLAPGEENWFEVRQENLPRNWNYRVPITEVMRIGY